MVLLTVLLVCAALIADIYWLKMIWEKQDFSKLIGFCVGQLLFFFPVNFCALRLKQYIETDSDTIRLFFPETNQHLEIPKQEVERVRVLVDGFYETDPEEEPEELEEFKDVTVIFLLKNQEKISLTSHYLNGKNLIKLYRELP